MNVVFTIVFLVVDALFISPFFFSKVDGIIATAIILLLTIIAILFVIIVSYVDSHLNWCHLTKKELESADDRIDEVIHRLNTDPNLMKLETSTMFEQINAELKDVGIKVRVSCI